jgi:hypothetical protein
LEKALTMKAVHGDFLPTNQNLTGQVARLFLILCPAKRMTGQTLESILERTTLLNFRDKSLYDFISSIVCP